MTRDRNDTIRSDALLVNLAGADRVSIGTVMEIAWADLKRIPIILVMTHRDLVHRHSMLLEAAGWVVPTLDEGIETTCMVLGV
jgi:nucleoside 2-deoxyribosyltransferase